MTIVFTVTNDLSYDQRMQRICRTLVSSGYRVLLVGRVLPHSIPLEINTFEQKRLHCFAKNGFLFYAEYNLRLFWFLMTRRGYDAICSIDLDTLTAGFLASVLRRKKRVFDAHEYFTEVPEVVHRPVVKAFWTALAACILPFYRHAYTVGEGLAELFHKRYGIPFAVVRNVAAKETASMQQTRPDDKILLYQGALNEGRGLEAALLAMTQLQGVQLVLAGEGDLSEPLRQQTRDLNVSEKVDFKGFVRPSDLKLLTSTAWVGLNLLENRGLSYYYSLANKFFDCVQAGVPIITMDFPEYRALNRQFEVALLLPTLSPEAVAAAVQRLLDEPDFYLQLRANCLKAREVWHWEAESEVLLNFWKNV
jgi:glycosyltransferase involved in cell wall biosynthesis